MRGLLTWKKLISKEDFWPLLVVLFFGFLASRHLFTPGYFNMHDDLQMMRQLQLEKCFLDGQIPCRWVPDMGFGFGFPLFNFYPPLPYLVGQVIRLVGFSYVDTSKILFSFAFIASGVTMYYLAKQFFGRLGGILAAVFYIWAPYHSVDIFVRGAMNEAWALIWFPAILWTAYRLIVSENKHIVWIISLALSWFALLTSHNLMVMIFAPVFMVWCLFWLLRNASGNKIPSLIISGILSFGLAAFFTLPVFLEQKLVHANTLVQGYFEFSAHFVTLKQLLWNRFWGYGPSVWMDMDDRMSFQIGEAHWILALIVLAFAVYYLYKRKVENTFRTNVVLSVVFFVLVGWFAAFMSHSKSTPLWQAVEPLKFVQFPWRWLTLVILGFSFAVGGLTVLISKAARFIIVPILCLFLVVFNWNYFKPEGGKMGPLTDQQKFSGAAWDLQRTAGIYDYLPITAKENPRDGYKVLAEVIEGEADIINSKLGTNWASFTVDVSKPSKIRINQYDFPNWRVFIDGSETNHFVDESERWGRMYINIDEGTHEVYAKLYDTPVRTAGNLISLVSWVGLLGFIVIKRKELV